MLGSWKRFTKENVKREKNTIGVYELANKNDTTHYIGEGKVTDRLNSHFIKNSDPIPGTAKFRTGRTNSKKLAQSKESSLLDAYKKKYGKLPKYNQHTG